MLRGADHGLVEVVNDIYRESTFEGTCKTSIYERFKQQKQISTTSTKSPSNLVCPIGKICLRFPSIQAPTRATGGGLKCSEAPIMAS